MDEKRSTCMKKLENSRKKIKIKSSTHVKFGLVQKSRYSGPLVLGNYKKQRKKRRSRLDSPLPLSPLFLFLFYFPLVPVVRKLAKKTLVSSRCKMILFMNWHSIVDTSWSRSSKYSNQCPLWRRKMFVDSYAYKTSIRLHEIFNINTPIICKFYERISTICNYLYAQVNTRQTI